jgi:hypothetical protein
LKKYHESLPGLPKSSDMLEEVEATLEMKRLRANLSMMKSQIEVSP